MARTMARPTSDNIGQIIDSSQETIDTELIISQQAEVSKHLFNCAERNSVHQIRSVELAQRSD